MRQGIIILQNWLPQQMAFVVRIISTLLLLVALATSNAYARDEVTFEEIRQWVQLSEYIGVDYAEAVTDGHVVNAGEYSEMQEFSALLVDKSRKYIGTAEHFNAIHQHALSLQLDIEQKRDIATIRYQSTQLRSSLLKLMPQSELPVQLLSNQSVEALFQENCSACHGLSGQGDGVMAAQLEPAPTDFTDKQRAMNRSILGLFESISQGIADTSMPAFKQLTELERWSLAYHVGSLAFQSVDETVVSDAAANVSGNITKGQFTFRTPAQLLNEVPGQAELVMSLRAHPELVMETKTDPLSLTRARLIAALHAYQQQDLATARNLTVSAYLDGFELVENSLNAHDPELRKAIEANLMLLRNQVKQKDNEAALSEHLDTTLKQLDEAKRLLDDTALSDAALFSASLVILLREGLEALLVVIALTTVLVKTERRDAVKYVHLGWMAALVAGTGTWALAQSLISISGAGREIMEGVAALLAALMLFYVGVWMHSKTHAAHWQAYIKRHINARLASGALWGLSALAFIAVYREVFETVLFYQALMSQAVSNQSSVVLAGFITGVLLLALAAWLLFRYSVKLPVSSFFATTTYLMLTLSFILAGKAVMALQEAAVIAVSPLPVSFEVGLLGVKSTWQGILVQSGIVVMFLVFVQRSKRQADLVDQL